MRVTRAQILPLFLLLACMFGCKAGSLLKVAGVVAITTLRVAAIAAAASSHHHRVEAASAQTTADAAEAHRRAEAAANRPGQCTELFVDTLPPGAPGNTRPARAAECGGRVIIQDEEGHWRSYGPKTVPAIQEP